MLRLFKDGIQDMHTRKIISLYWKKIRPTESNHTVSIHTDPNSVTNGMII